MYMMHIKINLKKEVGIAIISKETSNQSEPVGNSYVTTVGP